MAKGLRKIVSAGIIALSSGCATLQPVQYVEIETMKVYDGSLPQDVRQFAEKTSHETLTIIAENFYRADTYDEKDLEKMFDDDAQSTRDMRLWNDMKARGADFFVRSEERYEEKTQVSEEGTKKERTIFITGDFYRLRRQK